jgi:hypothetical protein
LEEGVWGRNLLKVSPPLARPHQILVLPPVHPAEPVPPKEQRQEIARKAAAARWGKTKQSRPCLSAKSDHRNCPTVGRNCAQRVHGSRCCFNAHDQTLAEHAERYLICNVNRSDGVNGVTGPVDCIYDHRIY